MPGHTWVSDQVLLLWPQVTELSDQLKAAVAEAEYINTQEKMFGWASTKYGNVTKVGWAS